MKFVRFAAFSVVLVTISMAAKAQSAADGGACQVPPTMLALVSDPFVTQATHRRVHLHTEPAGWSGASGLSEQWVEHKRKDWFVENQRDGADLIEAGVVLKNHAMVEQGLHMFEWAFARQGADGGWRETGDAFHSVTVFLVDVERSLLVLEEAQPEFKELEPRAKALVPKVHAADEWLLRPDVLSAGKQKDEPFTHRRWILAAVLGDGGQLTGDRKLSEAAVKAAKEGIALQSKDGENPERGGFDVSYQMVDALQGARYYTSLRCPEDAALMAQVRLMLERTCQWEMRHLLPDGSVDVAGSTRMLKETNRGGDIKHINYKEVIQAMAYTSMITRDPQYLAVAKKMAASQGW